MKVISVSKKMYFMKKMFKDFKELKKIEKYNIRPTVNITYIL